MVSRFIPYVLTKKNVRLRRGKIWLNSRSWRTPLLLTICCTRVPQRSSKKRCRFPGHKSGIDNYLSLPEEQRSPRQIKTQLEPVQQKTLIKFGSTQSFNHRIWKSQFFCLLFGRRYRRIVHLRNQMCRPTHACVKTHPHYGKHLIRRDSERFLQSLKVTFTWGHEYFKREEVNLLLLCTNRKKHLVFQTFQTNYPKW